MLALRKDGLAQADEYSEGRRELLSILIRKFIVARLVSVHSFEAENPP